VVKRNNEGKKSDGRSHQTKGRGSGKERRGKDREEAKSVHVKQYQEKKVRARTRLLRFVFSAGTCLKGDCKTEKSDMHTRR